AMILRGRKGAWSSVWAAPPAFAKAWWWRPASRATARRPEPLYVFGAAGAPSDNRKTEPRGALNASSLARLHRRSLRSLPSKRRSKKVEDNQRPSIDKSGHLRVRPGPLQFS